MPQFNYTAVTKNGDRIKGVVNAPNELEVRVVLRSQQLRPVRISQVGALDLDLAQLPFFNSVPSKDLLVFTRQMSVLLSAGIPVVQALETIGQQLKNQNLKRIVLSVREKVTSGNYLWEAMSTYKDIFSPIYISLIRAGELSGALDVILKRIVKHLDDSERLKKMVKSAMVYPVVVLGIGVGVLVLMLTFVIPKFADILKSTNSTLPAPTQFVINMSKFFQHNSLFVVLGFIAVTYLLRFYLKTHEGRRFFDYMILQIPIFGSVMQKVVISRFARTVQTLLSSGINLLDALEICKTAIGNQTVEESITRIKAEVENGKTLSAVMAKMPVFPVMVTQMVSVGEATGSMDKILQTVADFYEEEVQGAVANLSKMIEPFVLVFLGGTVGGLMLALYLPIFKLGGN